MSPQAYTPAKRTPPREGGLIKEEEKGRGLESHEIRTHHFLKARLNYSREKKCSQPIVG